MKSALVSYHCVMSSVLDQGFTKIWFVSEGLGKAFGEGRGEG